MLTQNLYTVFTETLKSQPRLFVAVGAGQHEADRGLAQLADEVERKAAEAVAYLDARGRVVQTPTLRLQVAVVTFDEGEAVGTLRECGLFGGAATETPGSGVLLAYYAHEAVDKQAGAALTRRVVIDLTPRDAAPGRFETRWLGNTRTRELHDLDHRTAPCQIEEIARDRRYYFAGVEEAEALGYDLCAFCFGRERSRR